MRSSGFERRRLWLAAALIVPLVHGLGLSRPARATCSHLVSSRADRQFGLDELDELIANGPARLPVPERPAPCSGPGCSEKAPAPAPMSLPRVDRAEHWGLLSALAFAPKRAAYGWAIDDATEWPAPPRPSIFHPPPV